MLAGLRLESNITVATPKVSLLGGWLGLPTWASLPLDFTVLPGRSKIAGLAQVPLAALCDKVETLNGRSFNGDEVFAF